MRRLFLSASPQYNYLYCYYLLRIDRPMNEQSGVPTEDTNQCWFCHRGGHWRMMTCVRSTLSEGLVTSQKKHSPRGQEGIRPHHSVMWTVSYPMNESEKLIIPSGYAYLVATNVVHLRDGVGMSSLP